MGEGHTVDVLADSTTTWGDEVDKKETTPGERMSSCRHGMGPFGTLSSWQKSPRRTQARVEWKSHGKQPCSGRRLSLASAPATAAHPGRQNNGRTSFFCFTRHCH
ncbi:hypothetical protein IG631_22925 [Alternaria alternata]|nr:hypothetical protein IG631_22925 [Alternaria alternata]